jgi:hypothetical protein
MKFDKAIKKLFIRGIPHLLDHNRLYITQDCIDLGLINFYFFRLFAVYKRIVWVVLFLGQLNMALPVKCQHKSPGYHIPQCPVGLNPIPFLT